LSLQHLRDLRAQRTETANLKEQLVQAGLQPAGALKEAISTSKAEVEEAKKQLAEAQNQLRQELEEERKLQKLEKERNDELLLVQALVGQSIKDLDDKAQSMYLAFA
jgi:molybdopterin converting factor small subunit